MDVLIILWRIKLDDRLDEDLQKVLVDLLNIQIFVDVFTEVDGGYTKVVHRIDLGFYFLFGLIWLVLGQFNFNWLWSDFSLRILRFLFDNLRCSHVEVNKVSRSLSECVLQSKF